MNSLIYVSLLNVICATAAEIVEWNFEERGGLTDVQRRNLTLTEVATWSGVECGIHCMRWCGCEAFILGPTCVLLYRPVDAALRGPLTYYVRNVDDSPRNRNRTSQCVRVFGNEEVVYPARFTTQPEYEHSYSPISRIRAWSSGWPYYSLHGFGVEYAAGEVASIAAAHTDLLGECVLSPGEYVYRVDVTTVPYWSNGAPVISWVRFVTQAQVCEYGTIGDHTITTLTGHRLLYLSGCYGAMVDVMRFHFEYC